MKFENLAPGFNEKAYVVITAGSGCTSGVGYFEGEVHMSLNIQVNPPSIY